MNRRVHAPLLIGLIALVVFPASAPAAPPQVSSTAVSHVTTTAVRLEARVNPEGKSISYRFEYGTSTCSVEADPCVSNPELEGVSSTKGTAPERITGMLEGLAPGATYHFRIIASNAAEETAYGADTTFTTFRASPGFNPCANEVLRTVEPSFLLPDCRAY
jgi:hypothetical protein